MLVALAESSLKQRPSHRTDKWLSPLQKEILAALNDFAFADEHVPMWVKPRDILDRLKGPATPSQRAAVSRALLRLHERDLLVRAAVEGPSGKSFRYARIRNYNSF